MTVPLFDIHRKAIERNRAVIARPIVRLGERISPSTVSGLVSTGVVDTIQAKAGRAWSHVGEERLKGIAPFLRHRDAYRSVSDVVLPVRISTASLGTLPRPVFAGVEMPMRKDSGCSHFYPQTSTTAGAATAQQRPVDDDFFPARATTTPAPTAEESGLAGRWTYNCKSSERIARLIDNHGTV
jgi:hypothetical protein